MIPLEAESSAGRLEASIALPDAPAPLAVVLCHGLPSGMPRDPGDPGYPGLARDLAALGLAASTFSFRGCYRSPGDFSLSGWIGDLRAVVDAAAARAGCPVAIAGSSLGGSVALLHAAADERVRAVATLAAPATLSFPPGGLDAFTERALGLIRTPGFPPDPGAWAEELASSSPEGAAGALGPRPLLVLQGTEDDLVPVEHARRLAGAASGPVTTAVLPGSGHQLRRDTRAVRVLFAWLLAQSRGLPGG